MNAPTLRIYVADLAAYNAGKLKGEWLDVNDYADATELRHAMDEAASGNEWAVHDREGWGELDPENLAVEDMVAVSLAVAEHGPAVLAYCADVGVEYGLETFEEAFQGEWNTTEEYAEDLVDSIEGLRPDSLLSRYFDLEAFTRDLFIQDYTAHAAEGGGVYVFRNM